MTRRILTPCFCRHKNLCSPDVAEPLINEQLFVSSDKSVKEFYVAFLLFAFFPFPCCLELFR